MKSVSEQLRDGAVSPAERKVASALLEGFPTRALSKVDAIAKMASVSAPTVLRYLAKIGYPRFADFQTAVIADVERKLGSPLHNLPGDAAAPLGEHVYSTTLLKQSDALRRAAEQNVPAEFDVIAAALASGKNRVFLLGGRYSQILAQRLALHLAQLRENVTFLVAGGGFLFDTLVDIGPGDVFVVFDYRRYQAETCEFARIAHKAGAKIYLLTDIWRSPIAEFADAVLTSPDDSTSPFGSRVVATAQVEALIASIAERRTKESRARLGRIEELRALGKAAALKG